jgi:hypothetical protein
MAKDKRFVGHIDVRCPRSADDGQKHAVKLSVDRSPLVRRIRSGRQGIARAPYR